MTQPQAYDRSETKLLQESIETLKQFKIAIEALRSIAFEEKPDQDKQEYWLEKTHAECAKVTANDTWIAREALKEIRAMNRGSQDTCKGTNL